jgi:small ligand-binding sensory domain FIST
MRWGSAVSNNASLQGAVEECVSSVLDGLEGLRPDLAFVFLSAAHAPAYDEVPGLVRRGLGDCPLLGCSGGGVIGAGREVEGGPGLAIAAAAMPEAELSLFHVENDGLPDQDSPPERWWEVVGSSPDGQPDFILLADPFSFAADRLIAGLDYAFPGSATIGGLASGAHGPGGNALYVGDEVRTSGAVGVAVAGSVTIDTVVAQGCRPIGAPMQVTSCADNWLLALDGKTPVQALVDVMGRLDEGERNLARHSLFLGVAMDRLNETPSMGDFLIRNIVGVDQSRGYIAIGELPSEGQLVQFHLRDAQTSTEDLDAMLNRYSIEHPIYEETGALLFSCLGRGLNLFGRADHDTDMFREKVNAMPLTGFFCNGEIGPVGGTTFLHGYTSSFGIFRTR